MLNLHTQLPGCWTRASFTPQQPKQRRRAALVCRATAQGGDVAPKRRVVVTGMGVVTPLGNENFDASDYTTRFAGEIKSLHSEGYVLKKLEKRLDNCIKYVLVAGKKAIQDAGLPWEQAQSKSHLNLQRCGILVGSAFGGMTSFTNAVAALHTSGFRKMNPFCIPFAIANMPGAMLAMDTGYMGPNYAISTACATGNYCILNAAQHIIRGDADLMLAGAGDATIIPSAMGGFIACKALSRRNDDPAAASRPWDKNRDGFVMGEGAGVLVLEELEHAKARGARIYAEFIGGSFSCDAHHYTEPQPEGKGVVMALQKALTAAGVSAEEVGYINAHATSTQAGDMAEYKAIRQVLPHADLKMNSTKSMIGHLLGGAGAVEAVATIMALHTGQLHPNLNLEDPEDAVELSVVVGRTHEPMPAGKTVALSNSFGFGGHNSSIIFKAASS